MNQRNPGLAFAGVILGFFMALLDATIVNIAIPDMMKDMAATVDQISWVSNGYNLAFAVLILVGARLADQFGRKRLFVVSLIIFTLSSLMASLSQDMGFLVFSRILQGLSGAILVPVTIPIAMRMFGKEKHGLIMGIWGGVSGLAAALGPFLGGILTSTLGWRSIFWVNLPIGIISLIITLALVQESKDEKATKRHDLLGMLSISASLFALVYALINVHDWGWTSPNTLVLIGLSVAFAVTFVVIELKSKEPMLPLGLFKNRIFSIGSLGLLFFGAAIIGSMFLMSFYLRVDLGLDTLTAGMVLAATPFASMVVSIIAGPLAMKMNHKYLAFLGSLLCGLAMFFALSLHRDSSIFDAVWRLSILGAGIGLFMTPVIGTAVRAVPSDKIGMASGVTNMTRAVGGVLGVAILIAVLQGSVQTAITEAKANVKTLVSSDNILLPPLREGLMAKLEAAPSQGVESEFSSGESKKIYADIEGGLLSGLEQINKASVAKGLAPIDIEGQKAQIHKIVLSIENEYAKATEASFGQSFTAAIVICVLGAFLMLFSGPRLEHDANAEPVMAVGEA